MLWRSKEVQVHAVSRCLVRVVFQVAGLARAASREMNKCSQVAQERRRVKTSTRLGWRRSSSCKIGRSHVGFPPTRSVMEGQVGRRNRHAWLVSITLGQEGPTERCWRARAGIEEGCEHGYVRLAVETQGALRMNKLGGLYLLGQGTSLLVHIICVCFVRLV
ncbi:hypothetical protein CAOG_09084 [Capsaspora owczarzaki ATCC 30864]|uniref:hypothetical protein n=1 Tax=Capsaspora owczarzaki (strain ATCC 30864) TaxID=595528 RepID=UPI0003523396|nr:hypothetical protein CAOG_08498 [Capsaspora owczarzaki ATCC 30864]XP_011270817.1 hypothetical protein CAOG_09084 [Capsaspora owczarzaki ATCC 30864]|eukprot:XP_011270080.1 hypothetical protein CAOG_08498 [Capsaspora owczarzaki ATCC 30864]